MAGDDRARWDEKWAEQTRPREPNRYLLAWRRHLVGGIAIDVACGLGQNSVWLAQAGYRVLGVDVSRVALQRAAGLARAAACAPQTLFAQVDLDVWRLPAHCCDLLCVFRFLDRSLIPSLQAAVKPGGLLVYETRHTGLLRKQPQANRAYLLQPGELLHIFEGWGVMAYEEGVQNAAVCARKPGAAA